MPSLNVGIKTNTHNPVTTFTPPLNHNTAGNPPSLLNNHPLMIAPANNSTTDAARRFLRTLFVANSLKSPMRSQYVDVRTLTGSSLNPSNRDVAICIPDWKANGGMRQTMRMLSMTDAGSRTFGAVPRGFWGMMSVGWAMPAATMMRRPWMRKSEASQRRLRLGPSGVMSLEILKVRKAPMRKVARETRVVSQAWGFSGSPAVERPRMTVLPAVFV
ncbi:hypothetical protein Tdes44962_MAKER02335 [Teratosphaeria destructans]|uniref:Uncharacterized protein n=1 Tax=Teratosphaeria destructans TaxID=418781 RepID=A0A9W7W3D8_9PEZI|nr:hypothetical protein Tdes44962_MAKER02335 [Teratosphaeria destructans]